MNIDEKLMIFSLFRGGSGSGKSSINALLLRYYDPTKGRVTYDGQGKLVYSLRPPRF